MIDVVESKLAPVKTRLADLENLLTISLTDDTLRTNTLKMLFEVISDGKDDIDFRRDCVAELALYESWEALELLIPILKDFNHPLWLVSANVMSSASTSSLADEIEQQVILPNKTRSDLMYEVAYLRAVVASIRKNMLEYNSFTRRQ